MQRKIEPAKNCQLRGVNTPYLLNSSRQKLGGRELKQRIESENLGDNNNQDGPLSSITSDVLYIGPQQLGTCGDR